MNTKTKKQELITKMQGLVADAKNNEMTEEQKAQFDYCKSQIDLMDTMGSDDNGVLPRKVPMDASFEPEKSKSGWMDGNGKQVKVYSHKDKAGNGQYSIGKFVRGILTGNWSGAEQEQGLYATTTSNNSAGGYAIPSILHSELIDLARSNSVLSAAGAQIVDLQAGSNKILRVKTDPTVEVKTELESFNASNPTFDLVEFTPFTLGCFMQVSQELAQDAQNFSEVIEKVMAGALGAKLDYLGIRGSGSGEPTGLINVSGINEVSVDTFDYDFILDGLNENQKDNCYSSNAYILSPTTNNTLVKLKEGTTNAYLQMPNDVAKLSKYITTGIADTDLIVGDFSNLYLGLRQGATFEMSPVEYDSFKKYALAFRIVMRADWQAVRPNHFCNCSTNVS
jgi:HK97 family phage major capsid protein